MKKLSLAVLSLILFFGMKAYAVQYQSLGGVSLATSTVTGGFQVFLASAANWQVTTPTAVGQIVGCTNCGVGTLCISTGTGIGAYVSVTSGTVTSSVQCK